MLPGRTAEHIGLRLEIFSWEVYTLRMLDDEKWQQAGGGSAGLP